MRACAVYTRPTRDTRTYNVHTRTYTHPFRMHIYIARVFSSSVRFFRGCATRRISRELFLNASDVTLMYPRLARLRRALHVRNAPPRRIHHREDNCARPVDTTRTALFLSPCPSSSFSLPLSFFPHRRMLNSKRLSTAAISITPSLGAPTRAEQFGTRRDDPRVFFLNVLDAFLRGAAAWTCGY